MKIVAQMRGRAFIALVLNCSMNKKIDTVPVGHFAG